MNSHLIIGSGHAARFVILLVKKFLPADTITLISRNVHQAISKLSEFPEVRIFSAEEKAVSADILWLAVPDDKISDTFQQYKSLAGKAIIHLSGATPVEVISGGISLPMVIWPVASLSLPYNLAEIPLVAECSEEHFLFRTLCEKKLQIIKTNYENRLRMHMLAVAANNFVHHIHALIEEELNHQKLSKDFLKPLIEQTFRNFQNNSLKILQTGPARRGDSNTIQKHLDIIKTPDLKNLYQTLTSSIHHFYATEL